VCSASDQTPFKTHAPLNAGLAGKNETFPANEVALSPLDQTKPETRLYQTISALCEKSKKHAGRFSLFSSVWTFIISSVSSFHCDYESRRLFAENIFTLMYLYL